jgi:ubiquitin
MPTGKTAKVEVSHPRTIKDVKRQMKAGIPLYAQRLTYNDRVLEDKVVIYDYNIQNGSKMELMVLGSKCILCRG